jgi:hypothetical protein
MANTGTKLYFSGVESKRLLETFQQFNVQDIQLSYFYLRRIFADPGEASQALKAFPNVILDHGLVFHKYKSEPEKETFLNDYYEYVSNLDPKSYSAVVAHIDLEMDKIIDTEKLIYTMEDLMELLDGDTKSAFMNADYVGLSNDTAKTEDRMSALCSQATKSGTRLHAFGTSSQAILKRWPIYSANTSSWRTGSRYANTYLYEGIGRGLHLYQPTDKSDLPKTDREKKNWRTRQKAAVEARQPNLGTLIDWEACISDDESWEVDKANLTQWILYQRDLSLDPKNAYWLTEDEKAHLLELRKETQGTVVGNRDETPKVRSSEDATVESRNIEPVLEGEIITESDIGTELDTPRPTRIREVDTRLLQPRMCDSCILANRCPKFSPGASCAYGIQDAYDTEKLDDHVKENMADLLQMQMDRIMQGYLEEKADGAGLSKDLSRELKAYTEMVNLYNTSVGSQDSLEIKAKGTGIMGLFNQKK